MKQCLTNATAVLRSPGRSDRDYQAGKTQGIEECMKIGDSFE